MQEIIQFLNHASFIVSNDKYRLISDPWVKGRAFNQGWQLLVDTPDVHERFDQEIAKATHIWISHEHPDHFSVPTLKSIPAEIKKNITVLFHFTQDKRVINFLSNAGFKEVIELKDKETYQIDEDFEITCQSHKHLDSWLYIAIKGKKIVNINDCGITDITQAKRVKAITGEVDVLLTQFSYANWVGNVDEEQRRFDNYDEHYEFIKAQHAVLRPKFIIPFASFIRFCHPENHSLNNGFPTINRMLESFKKLKGTQTILMQPGQIWDCDSDVNNDKSIAFYALYEEQSVEIVQPKETLYDFETLEKSSDTYIKKIHQNNFSLVIRLLKWGKYFRSVNIKLTDLDITVNLDIVKGLTKVNNLDNNEIDILLSSDSLNYALNFDWGAETLYVNGKYQIQRHERIFFRQFYISILNSCGYFFPFGVIKFLFKEKIAWRLGL